MTRAGARFSRVEPRRRARAFVLGLLAELPRKNCWTIAEHAGDRTPDGMQHLLSRARWDAGGVRDDVRSYVVEQLGDPGAVLVADETGDVKKGTATPGVQRQYTGTAGRIENAQVAVYLGYAAPRGHALIDRALYLPKSWTGDPARCEAAGIPGHAAFATKPQLASLMIERAVSARVPFAWVAADEAYGDNGPLRTWLEQQHIAYVLAVARDHRVPAGVGRTVRADELAARLPRRAWQRLSAGDGAKGHRWYDWAWVTISNPGPGHRCLLIRLWSPPSRRRRRRQQSRTSADAMLTIAACDRCFSRSRHAGRCTRSPAGNRRRPPIPFPVPHLVPRLVPLLVPLLLRACSCSCS